MAEPSPISKCEEVAQRCAGFGIRRAARAVANLYDQALAPCGLKGTQFTLLNAIATAGRPTITQLADLLLMDRTTLTRNLQPLARQGLVRITSSRDRRARDVALTPEGLKSVRRALPLWEKAQCIVETRFGHKRLTRLRDDLSELEQLTLVR